MKRLLLSILMAPALWAQTVPAQGEAPNATPEPVLAKRCEAKLSGGNAEAAERCFRAALREASGIARLHAGLAEALLGQDKTVEAEAQLRTAAGLAPSDPKYARSWLDLLVRQNAPEKVLKLAPAFVRRWPARPEFPALYGWALARTGQIEAARLQYRKAASLAGKNKAEYYDAFASVLEGIGQADEAIRALREKLEATTPTATDRARLGRLLERQRRWDEAEAEFRAADRLSGRNYETEFFAGRLAAAGQTDQAIRIYKEIVKASPFDSLAVDKLVDLLTAGKRWDELSSVCADAAKPGGLGGASCMLLIRTLADAGDLDGALAVYRANPTANQLYADDLLKRLSPAGRLGDAREVCKSAPQYVCNGVVKELFSAGRKMEAVAFARAMAENSPIGKPDFQLALIADLLTDMAVEDQLALHVEATKLGTNGFHLAQFLKKMQTLGQLTEVMDALRRQAPGLDMDAVSWSLGEETFYQLVYQGYITATAKESVQLVDRKCQFAFGEHEELLKIQQGETVRLAHPGRGACHGLAHLTVEYQGHPWGVFYLSFKHEVAPASAEIRPLPATKFEEVVAAMPIHSAASTSARAGAPVSGNRPLDEITLGFNTRRDILSKHPVYDDSAPAQAGSRAFQMLMSTSIARSGKVGAFQLTLLNDNTMNAFSTAGGQIYVNKGMLPVVGNETGMWAAVIGHEAGHVVAHHHYKQYVRQFELAVSRELLRQQAATGNKAAQWAYLFSLGGGHVLKMKLNRNDELEADRLGLLMMAEAGIHPDFSLALMSRLHQTTRDKSKMATFLLSDHPRWETREKKVKDAYAEALRVFQSRWANATDSPGGVPPKP